eukprot:TRINITY_DN238_c0_g1_i1.p1 TRINITY_DN238_c0_g1~~TRINITY_DN238_c0_g1_i1.p1  ORF type:complete len:518 (+),score=237.80 TRINITY_DN238_c0_g1_i1:107-1660(+)
MAAADVDIDTMDFEAEDTVEQKRENQTESEYLAYVESMRQEKLKRIEEERMKSHEIKVQLNKASRADAEPSPRKNEDKEPEWVSKRKSVTINAPVKIEKDIVNKEERDVTAPWAKDLKLKKSTTKEPAPLVQAPSTQQEPKAQIIAKGVASGGENPWGVQLKKNRPGETEEPKPAKSEPVPEFVQKSLARKSVKLDKSALETAQNGGTSSSNPSSARSAEPTSARANLPAVDEDAEIERMVREEMEREEADRQKKRDEEKRKAEEEDRLIREDLEREEAELKQKEEERKAREAEEKRKAEEAEEKRKAEEQAESERLAREIEEKRKADEIEDQRRQEAEAKRLEEEAENKRKAEEQAENERVARAAREAEAEEKRKVEEEAENRRKAEEQAENERLAREAEETKRREEEAENKRKAEEQAENERLAREAEEKQKAEQESEAKVAPSATAGGIDSNTFAAAMKRVQDLEAWVEKSQGTLASLESDNKSLKVSLIEVKANNQKLTQEVADLQKILDGLN